MKFKYPFGATPIDDDELSDSIPEHITLQKELNEWEQANINKAAGIFYGKSFNSENILSFSFILDVHKNMFDETWRWAGKTRKTVKNIGVEVSQIFEQTKNLCEDVKYWIKNNTFPDEEIGVRFHHRLVKIHLFPNGNGRHARLITDLLMKSLDKPMFTWGSKDLYNEGTVRKDYINALKEADNNNYKSLIEFVKS
jgi:Fic-DOC domain mobile mystery protein B